jgi:general secretion pathway protein D
LLVILLSALSLAAQAPAPTPSDTSNRIETLRRALRSTANTNAPPGIPSPPGAVAPRIVPTQTSPAAAAADQTPAAQPPAATVPTPNFAADAVPPSPTVPPVATASMAAPAPAALEEEKITPGMIDFASADIGQVLTIYSKLVNRTILRPSTLPTATVVLKTQTDLTRAEAIQALDAVLALNGISMINVSDKFVKALPLNLANAAGAPVSTNAASDLPELGSYVTHIVQTKFLKPSELAPALSPFQSMATAVMPIDTSGILVLRDNAENVKRMLEMVERVDISVESEFISEVIPIKFAKAEDIASALNSLSSGGGGATVGTRATAPTTGAGAGQRPGQLGYPGQPGQPMTPGAATTGTPSSSASFSDRLRNIIQRASASGDLQILGTTKIIADVRSNSLLVFASRADLKMIKEVVDKLDVVLAQVLIETVIMDVSLDDSWALGISAAQTPRKFSGDFSGAGGMNLKRFTDIAAGGGSTSGGQTNAFTDLIGTGLRYFGVVDDDIYIQLEAAASESRVNVIQKPRIQTSHATPASIFIGSTVPYVSSTYYGGGYAGGPSSSFQQLRVGIGLNVTPFINADGLVVMKIDETIDEISGSTAITGVGDVPNTTSRTLSAEVAVQDGETIILGGFIRNSETKSKSGVPILKDIPLLGYLFRSTGDAKERKELIVLMRPTVLRTPELAAAHVEIEKARLPGVRAAEQDFEKLEQRALERQEKKSSKRSSRSAVEGAPQYSTPPPDTSTP